MAVLRGLRSGYVDAVTVIRRQRSGARVELIVDTVNVINFCDDD